MKTHLLFLSFAFGCTPDLPLADSIQAMQSVNQAEPRVDEQSSDPESSFESVNLSLAGIDFEGTVVGDGEVWTGNVDVDGFLPADFDESISAEVSASWQDVEVLDSGFVFDGHADLETGVEDLGSNDVVFWLILDGTMKVDVGDSRGAVDFSVDVKVEGEVVTIVVIANEEDVTEDFENGEFTSYLVFHD